MELNKLENQQVIFTHNKQSEWTIVVSEQCSPSEHYAALELQRFVKDISDVTLQIRHDTKPFFPKIIIVGFNRYIKDGCGIDRQAITELGDEGYYLDISEDCIVIVGGALRGTLYGVYSFLEDYLGCRWYTSEISHIPRRDEIVLPITKKKFIPELEYRDSYFFDAFDGDWAARNKVNGFRTNAQDKHGGNVKYALFVHTFDTLLPASAYYDEHPEYFCLVDGERLKEQCQPCLTTEAVFDIVLEQVKRWLADNPDATIISVSQNDYYNPCECEKCASIDAYENSHAGTLIYFVNRIAEALECEYPNIIIDTLAYQYSRKPPKYVKPHKNVAVRLSTIECCFSHPMEECQEIASFKENRKSSRLLKEDIEGWSAICDRLYIWDYVTNFAHYLLPFPNFEVLKPNIQFFIKNHAKGVFEEGNYSRGSGELSPLRQYVIAKLLWDKDYDVEVAIDEFLIAYFSMAAPIIKQYIALLQSQVVTPYRHVGFYDPPSAEYLTSEFLEKADELFKKAEIIADNKEILKRVKAARLSIEYVRIGQQPTDEQGRLQRIDEFYDQLKENGITEIKEVIPVGDSIAEMKSMV